MRRGAADVRARVRSGTVSTRGRAKELAASANDDEERDRCRRRHTEWWQRQQEVYLGLKTGAHHNRVRDHTYREP